MRHLLLRKPWPLRQNRNLAYATNILGDMASENTYGVFWSTVQGTNIYDLSTRGIHMAW